MQSLITFPLYDFDLGEHVAFKEAGKSYMYDLYGIVNHYGTMSFGHYIGFVKNEHTGEWLKYNDSRVTPITEDQVQTNAAYILFYKRKDLADKKMEEVIPTLNVTKFPGMPVRLTSGKIGYLLEYREGNPCPYVVGLGVNTIMYLSEDSIVLDKDTWPARKAKTVPTGNYPAAATATAPPVRTRRQKKIPKVGGTGGGAGDCVPF